jgi:hypothetical protein
LIVVARISTPLLEGDRMDDHSPHRKSNGKSRSLKLLTGKMFKNFRINRRPSVFDDF